MAQHPVDSGVLNQFAKADGFKNWAALYEWFAATHGLPFEGWVIDWLLS